MKHFILLLLILFVLMTLWFFGGARPAEAPIGSEIISNENKIETETDPVVALYIKEKSDLIQITEPAQGSVISSPLKISGEARGYWFFEASFPVILVDWDGRIIAEHYATAEEEWMTEEFVPYTSTIEFESPYHEGDPEFMSRGALILKRDNPSGLPENDDALEIPVTYFQTKI